MVELGSLLGVKRTSKALAASEAMGHTSWLLVAGLLAACSGEASAPVHAVLNALMQPDQAELSERVHALAGLGHSSGWDALGGVITVCGAGTPGWKVP